MKVEFKINKITGGNNQIRLSSIRLLINHERRIIFFAGRDSDENIHYRTAKMYKRRMNLDGYEII